MGGARGKVLRVVGTSARRKTELLNRFVAGKRAFFYEATDTTELSQLRSLSEELAVVSGNSLLAAQPATTWEAALAAIEQFASPGERSVVVLDEFQFLVARQSGLETLLNNWWRNTGSQLPLVFIIAGSEVSFFREDVLAGKMYGRRTGQLQLTPFDYRAAALFTPGYSAEDKVRTYSVCGGMPYYLDTWDDSVTVEQNILRNVLRRDGLLHEEASFCCGRSSQTRASTSRCLRQSPAVGPATTKSCSTPVSIRPRCISTFACWSASSLSSNAARSPPAPHL